MFEVFCPRHGGRVLLRPSAILASARGADGVIVRWRCYCGDIGASRLDRLPDEEHERRPSALVA